MAETSELEVRTLTDADRAWVREACEQHWGTSVMVSRGKAFDISEQEGFIAEVGGERIGLATYVIEQEECELGGLLSVHEGRGVGSVLLEKLADHARSAGCQRLWLVTTNDNVEGLRFYQKRRFSLVAVHSGAVDETRRTVKPGIPELGMHDIPLRDEIELEIVLK